MPTYNRLPLAFTRGEGVWLEDAEGNKYLDALSGIAVCGLGHAHPEISKAICDQASKEHQNQNGYFGQEQYRLDQKFHHLGFR